MRRLLPIVLTCVAIAGAAAAPLSPAARVEIDGLMSKLEAFGCEFNRNGTWYSGTETKARPGIFRAIGAGMTNNFVELRQRHECPSRVV